MGGGGASPYPVTGQKMYFVRGVEREKRTWEKELLTFQDDLNSPQGINYQIKGNMQGKVLEKGVLTEGWSLITGSAVDFSFWSLLDC